MERRHGLGLRAQIVLGLLAAFAVAFSALGLIVVQLAKRSNDLSRARRAQTIATALAIALEERDPEADLTQGLARRLGGDDVAGIAVSRGSTSLVRIGELRGPPSASALLDRGELLQLWLMPGDPSTDTPLAGLLRLYLSLTGCVIAVLAYVLLTRLIVGPVESLTRAAEQLAEGARSAQAPVGGAAEVARLAVTFNHMAAELRRQKGALEQRLSELEHTTLELSSTRDQLVRSEKLASVGRLAAGVAHEIGNPLAAITGLIELLQLGGLSQSEHDEFLARVRGETERIHRIIRELLDYARTPPEAVLEARGNLASVIEEAVKLIAPQKDLRLVTIEVRIHDDAPWVAASSHDMTQVVLNLLLNAADAVAGEGSILVELRRAGEGLELSVADTGPGIPEALLGRVFDPFFTTKPAGKGTGLGLAVCLSLVERFGGKIAAENTKGSGARFVLWLPAAPPDQAR
jgi:two-component system NtrC family sensor kinase